MNSAQRRKARKVGNVRLQPPLIRAVDSWTLGYWGLEQLLASTSHIAERLRAFHEKVFGADADKNPHDIH